MSPKPRPTFNKLQKERARQQKQRDKIERKQQRKQEKIAGHSSSGEDENLSINTQDLPDEPQDPDSNEMM